MIAALLISYGQASSTVRTCRVALPSCDSLSEGAGYFVPTEQQVR
jgi:hypothetical protein